MKPRHHLRLSDEISEWLEDISSKPGSSKSAIAEDAFRAYRNQRAGNEVDDLLKRRLDRISNSLTTLARDVEIVMESQALFINHYLTTTAPVPEADKAAQAIGLQRYQAFIESVGRTIAAGKGIVRQIEAMPATPAKLAEGGKS